MEESSPLFFVCHLTIPFDSVAFKMNLLNIWFTNQLY